MSCEEIRELLVAVSFGTATAEERELVEAHLAECDLDHGVAEDSTVAALLADSAPEMAPPAALRDRVMAAALGGQADSGGAMAPVERFEPPARGDAARGRSWLRRIAGPYQVAAVLAVALVGMIVWNVEMRSQPQDELFVHYYWGGDDNWLRLQTELGEPGAQVSLGGLETLQGDQTYHLWDTRGDQTLFVGVFNTNADGKWSGDFNFTFDAGDRLWITAQSPADGEGPHGDAVLRTRF